jgi:hypothetical protein
VAGIVNTAMWVQVSSCRTFLGQLKTVGLLRRTQIHDMYLILHLTSMLVATGRAQTAQAPRSVCFELCVSKVVLLTS